MFSSASERLNRTRTPGERAQGAALALLVQASFVLTILLSPSRLAPPHSPARETILLLRPSPQTTPGSIDAPGTLLRKPAPIQVPVLPNIAPPVLAPPSGIAGFGRSLFGCAPEHYADLPPDERAHCPKRAKAWRSTSRPTCSSLPNRIPKTKHFGWKNRRRPTGGRSAPVPMRSLNA
jgi:hypothetical protein